MKSSDCASASAQRPCQKAWSALSASCQRTKLATPRRRAVGEQLSCALELLECPVAVAAVEPHAGEPGPRLGRFLDLARGQKPVDRLGQHPVLEARVVYPAARVCQQQLGPLLIARGPE